MRGYVELMERLEYRAPEGRRVTDAEVLAAMSGQLAQRIDSAREELKWRTVAPPVSPTSGE